MKDKNINNIEASVMQIVTSIAHNDVVENITLESRLKNDLRFDSLNMMELCVSLEGAFNITIGVGIGNAKTVQDLIELVKSGDNGQSAMLYNIENYPLPKTKRHIRKLKRYMRLSLLAWRFEVTGIENLPADEKYILSPNHQSYLDCLWLWAAIGQNRVDLTKIACLAAEVFLPRKRLLAMLGGIPVERYGDTVPAMKRAIICIQNGYTMLIFPEGTRSRDGKIHEFKGGAAKLAIDSGVSLIPVRIEGAWDIFPPHRKLPKIFRFGRRYPIRISFGKPILPNGKSVEELTTQLQSEVERMGAVH
ncbi:MAG: 1-acyl-sn-glycerol-3-phosphate acyltransferase [Oscillospiraceae bacterium]|nr:1-acyl-sn-glycerol-3-phosphate acyltransferase [Oscillospiraceae bacterium]